MHQFKNGEEYYNRIYLIFNALIAISLLPFSIILLEIQDKGLEFAMIKGNWAYTIMATSVLIISFFTFKSFEQLKDLQGPLIAESSLREKLNIYHSFYLRHYIILNSFCVIVTAVLYLTKSNIMVVFYVFLLVLLSIHRPTLKRIVEQLKLSVEEQDTLYKKQDITE
jgi:hypothetical protein